MNDGCLVSRFVSRSFLSHVQGLLLFPICRLAVPVEEVGPGPAPGIFTVGQFAGSVQKSAFHRNLIKVSSAI